MTNFMLLFLDRRISITELTLFVFVLIASIKRDQNQLCNSLELSKQHNNNNNQFRFGAFADPSVWFEHRNKPQPSLEPTNSLSLRARLIDLGDASEFKNKLRNNINNLKSRQQKYKQKTSKTPTTIKTTTPNYDDLRQQNQMNDSNLTRLSLESTRRQFRPSEYEFDSPSSRQSANNQLVHLNSIDSGKVDDDDSVETLEMHTNNHQSSNKQFIDLPETNEEVQPGSSLENSRHYNKNNNHLFNNKQVYSASNNEIKDFYGSVLGNDNRHQNNNKKMNLGAYGSSHYMQNNLANINFNQDYQSPSSMLYNNLGAIPSKPTSSGGRGLSKLINHHGASNSIPMLSSYGNSFGQSVLIGKLTGVASSSAASTVASLASIPNPNANSNSLSFYSVPNLSSTMQQLLMQSGSATSSSVSPYLFQMQSHNQGQQNQLSKSNHDSSSSSNNIMIGGSLDDWNGSGNYLLGNNDDNELKLTVTTSSTQSPLYPQHNNYNFHHNHQNMNNFNNSAYSLDGIINCGRQQVGHREPRIVGGNSTYEGEFPWAVSIQRHGNHHCGGVIVGRKWILTAAHCVRSQLVSNLIVRTGGHTLSRSLNSINSHFERDYSVDSIIMHGDFSKYDNLTASQLKSSANTNNADIALIKLRNDIQWNEYAWPVCFAHRDVGNFSGHDAVVIGWGKLNEKSEDFSNELQKVKLNIIDNKLCQNWFRQAGREMPINERIICAGFKSGGKDACHGDSGGPLLSKVNGQFVVVGVVSTGIGCARPLLPGLYSRVSSYIDWIEEHVRQLDSAQPGSI